MRSLAVRAAVAVVLTVVVDYCLWDHAPGCGVAVVALAAALAALAAYGARLFRAPGWTLLWVALAAGACLESSLIGQYLLITLGWTVIAIGLVGERTSLLDGYVRGIAGGARSLTAAPSDSRRYALILIARRIGAVPPLWVLAIPLGLVICFSLLIVPANLVLTQWTINFTDRAINLLARIDELPIGRIAFWFIVALTGYGLVRFRLGRHHHRPRKPPIVRRLDESMRRHAVQVALLSLAGLNLLYLLVNVVDVIFLWLTFELPEGVTYAQFAHQGSYRLIAAVVLAAVTVVVLLPKGSLQLEHRMARGLSYLFVAQNLFVLASGARRLFLYVDVYGLTRFRVATVLWMLLVAAGYLLILARIYGRRPVGFLFRANTVSTALLLSVTAVLNIDGFIADWNVRRYEQIPPAMGRGDQSAVDVDYLASLEAASLPAIARLIEVARASGNPYVAEHAAEALDSRLKEERIKLQSWQSWTWRRAESVRRAEVIRQMSPSS